MSEIYSHRTINTSVLGSVLLFGVVELAIVYWLYPEYYTSYMLMIPIYFLILGVTLLLAMSRIESKRLHPGRAVARLMLLNASQFILSIGLLFYYIYCINMQRKSFLFVFGIFYIWFMCIKLFVLYHIDRQHKYKKTMFRKNGEKEK